MLKMEESWYRLLKDDRVKGTLVMLGECTKKKRVKDLEWFKDKMLLARKQEARIELDDHVDAFESDSDEAPTTRAIFMERISLVRSVNRDDVGPSYGTHILSDVPNYDNYHDNDMFHPSVQYLIILSNQILLTIHKAYWLPVSNKLVVDVKAENDVPKQLPKKSNLRLFFNKTKNQLDILDELIKEKMTINLHKEVMEMKEIFEGMETDVNACYVEKKYFQIEKKELLLENDRLLEESMSCDIMCTILRSIKNMDVYSELSCMFIDKCVECKNLEVELSKQTENVENKSSNEISK
ncbi:hypothetical protein Tco_0561626 [Tanacetum coccineum]